MPIYEFCCNQCQTGFEELVRNGNVPVCPSCGSADVRRLLSSFAVRAPSPDFPCAGAASAGVPDCSSCAACH
jgi:putative FmdB family regulatory protein